MKKIKNNNKNKDNNEKAIFFPKTKLQKLKIKHQKLLLVVIILLIVFLIVLIFSNKDNSNKNISKTTSTTNKVEVENSLNVYDVNSKTRPFAVMIPNDSVAKKRQYGIQKAYLTYEITVEGGITRLLALFKDTNVEKIGPVRSSRHYYLDYALENDAIYVHFGWSPQAQSDISDLGINNLNGLYNPSNMFWRDKNYSSPNNAFTSTDKINKASNDKKYNLKSDNYDNLKYKSKVDLTSDETIKDASNVKIYYSGNSFVKYVYDKTDERYLRYNNNNEHIDHLTNEQIKVKNIIVLKMDTVNISGDDKGRQNLSNIGNGNGYYITDGKCINITWNKDSRSSKTILKNKKGEEISVNDGNTFIQIQPINKNFEIE